MASSSALRSWQDTLPTCPCASRRYATACLASQSGDTQHLGLACSFLISACTVAICVEGVRQKRFTPIFLLNATKHHVDHKVRRRNKHRPRRFRHASRLPAFLLIDLSAGCPGRAGRAAVGSRRSTPPRLLAVLAVLAGLAVLASGPPGLRAPLPGLSHQDPFVPRAFGWWSCCGKGCTAYSGTEGVLAASVSKRVAAGGHLPESRMRRNCQTHAVKDQHTQG